jgi:hypothetical protein
MAIEEGKPEYEIAYWEDPTSSASAYCGLTKNCERRAEKGEVA